MKDTDFLFLGSMLRAREVRMLGSERIDRMLASEEFTDVVKQLIDFGFPDMSELSISEIDLMLEERRSEFFREMSAYSYVSDILDLFRMKYDYHNVKVLVKSIGADIEAEHLLSSSGRIDPTILRDAYISGQFEDLPQPIASAFESSSGVLSRTDNPQLSDIDTDKFYFNELSALAKKLKNDFVTGYVRLLIDTANLKIIVRSSRIGRNIDFLKDTLIPDGSVGVDELLKSLEDEKPLPFDNNALDLAIRLGTSAMEGDSQTPFELACDNAVLHYVTNTKSIGFGSAPVIAYFAKIEWEITIIRMILTGKNTGISSEVIRERLRECNV